MRGTILLLLAMVIIAAADERRELRDLRSDFERITKPSETDRVRYVTSLVRLRESYTRADAAIMDQIDAEIERHPMPANVNSKTLVRRLIGQWQSPRHAYFYYANGTWASDDDTPKQTAGTWRIQGNRFFQNYKGMDPDSGGIIILLTDTDFIYEGPYYLRRGTIFPWRG